MDKTDRRGVRQVGFLTASNDLLDTIMIYYNVYRIIVEFNMPFLAISIRCTMQLYLAFYFHMVGSNQASNDGSRMKNDRESHKTRCLKLPHASHLDNLC